MKLEKSFIITESALISILIGCLISLMNVQAEAMIEPIRPERTYNSYLDSQVIEEEYVEPIVLELSYDVIGSVSMRNISGQLIDTDEIEIAIEPLEDAYRAVYESYEWDTHEQINVLSVMWEFLVNQQGMSPMNAAGVLGSIACEGDFAEQQGTSLYISNIEQARILLGTGSHGYGVAQWTYKTRQKNLLKYYEMAYELYPDDWTKVRIIAECCMLLEEVKAYEVFGDIYSDTSIEDAVGRMCLRYEKYEGCTEQWDSNDGVYYLVSDSGSGKTRLRYANAVYEHFVGGM